MKFHPRFPEVILGFKEDPDAYDNFVIIVCFFEWIDWCIYALISINTKMVEAFGNARASDTNSAHYETPTFIPLDPLVDIVQPPITSNKSTQGFNHPVVGKLLCPLRLLLEYEEDPMWVPITYTNHGLRAQPVLQTIQEQGRECNHPAVFPWWTKLAIISLPPRHRV